MIEIEGSYHEGYDDGFEAGYTEGFEEGILNDELESFIAELRDLIEDYE